MLTKNILIYLTIFFLSISSISSKNENAKKFLSQLGIKSKLESPISFLEEDQSPEIKSFSTELGVINIKCLYSKGYNIYSFQKLKKDEDYSININKTENEKILLNFCRNTKTNENCTVLKEKNGTQIRLSGSIDGEGDNKNVWSEMMDEKNNNTFTGIKINLVEGEKCSDTERHQTTIKMYCDSKIEDSKFYETLKYSNPSKCEHIIEARSLYGCSLRSSYLFLRLLNEYYIVFAIIFIIFGFILCFLGFKYKEKIIMFVCGILGCYLITAAVLSWFPNLITDELGLIICLIVCFILGCIVGFFLKGEIKFNAILLGGFLGYSSATFVYQIVQNYVSDWNPEYVRYGCIGVCIVVGALLGYWLSDPILLLGTSVLGGYLVMRGISLIFGHYLDEGYILDLIKNKEFDQLKEIRDGWTYAYLGTWIVLTVVGTFIQCRDKRKSGKKGPGLLS